MNVAQLSYCTQQGVKRQTESLTYENNNSNKKLHAAFSSAHKSGKACRTQNSFSSAVPAAAAELSRSHSWSRRSGPCGGISLTFTVPGCANQNPWPEPSLTRLPSLCHTEGHHLVSSKGPLENILVGDCRQCDSW